MLYNAVDRLIAQSAQKAQFSSVVISLVNQTLLLSSSSSSE